MAYFLKSGKSFRVSSKEAMDLHESLPVGNYVIKEDSFGNLFLEQIEDFEIKGKLYGDLIRNTDRVLNTFQDRPATTGVMLAGEKGSGKSLLAKSIAINGAKQGIPTIVINAQWCGDRFNSFIQSIDQPTIILFDEFEKVYDSEHQEAILTLLDGVFPSKKLFVLTCNDKWRVDSHMRNRPGRIYYMMDFKGLTQDFIIEYCQDALNNKSYIDKICNITSLFSEFNFDMLKALVEEMNRYNESPEDALVMLNAKPEYDSGNSRYSVQLEIAGTVVDEKSLETATWTGNPLQKTINIDYKEYETPEVSPGDEPGLAVSSEWDWNNVRFSNADLKKIEPREGKFIFINIDGDKLVLSKVAEKQFNYYGAF